MRIWSLIGENCADTLSDSPCMFSWSQEEKKCVKLKLRGKDSVCPNRRLYLTNWSKSLQSHFDYGATAEALVLLHAVIWHSHLFLLIHWWCISSLIKALCCDAFNINHIQSAGRVQSSVYQRGKCSRLGCGIWASSLSYPVKIWSSPRGGLCKWVALYRTRHLFPIRTQSKVGTWDFQHHFSRGQRSQCFWMDRRSLEMRVEIPFGYYSEEMFRCWVW